MHCAPTLFPRCDTVKAIFASLALTHAHTCPFVPTWMTNVANSFLQSSVALSPSLSSQPLNISLIRFPWDPLPLPDCSSCDSNKSSGAVSVSRWSGKLRWRHIMVMYGHRPMPSCCSKLADWGFYRVFNGGYPKKNDSQSSRARSSSGMSEKRAWEDGPMESHGAPAESREVSWPIERWKASAVGIALLRLFRA